MSRRIFLSFIVLLGLASVGGCHATYLHAIAREDPIGSGRYVNVEGDRTSVIVYRDGQRIGVRPGHMLRGGDEIQTAANGAAVLRFKEGEIVLDGDTRVRVGSLEVIFGRILADLRGLFTVSSENVVAGVEGTSFVFDVRKGQSEVRVSAVEGVVVISSMKQRFESMRLLPGKECLYDESSWRSGPRIGPADMKQVEAFVARSRRVMTARPVGFCCRRGKVTCTTREKCKGGTFGDEETARGACTPGFCCQGTRVRATSRDLCQGAFFTQRVDAKRACEPTGFCCDGGRVSTGTKRQCRGTFHKTRPEATQACLPTVE